MQVDRSSTCRCIRRSLRRAKPVEAIHEIRRRHHLLGALVRNLHLGAVKHHLELATLVDLRHREQILAHVRHVQRVLDLDLALVAVGQNHSFHDGPHTLDCRLVAVGHRNFAFISLDQMCELGLVVADVVRCAAVDRPHPGHILARRNSTFHGNRERHSIVVVVVSVAVVSPLDVVGPASTAVAAASWPSVLVLLLGPALVNRVPHFSAVCTLARLSVGVERLGRVLRLHRRRLLTLSLDVLIREHLHDVLRPQFSAAHLQVDGRYGSWTRSLYEAEGGTSQTVGPERRHLRGRMKIRK
ncbi:hypothetical protein PC116_g31758 [Phytophthora cactorum]|nr:hypothetical protein PC116_g31758 [Phytophthora cactorum]